MAKNKHCWFTKFCIFNLFSKMIFWRKLASKIRHPTLEPAASIMHASIEPCTPNYACISDTLQLPLCIHLRHSTTFMLNISPKSCSFHVPWDYIPGFFRSTWKQNDTDNADRRFTVRSLCQHPVLQFESEKGLSYHIPFFQLVSINEL